MYATDDQERQMVIFEISMIYNAHIDFVNALQYYLLQMSNSEEKDSLILSFGVLASRAQYDAEVAVTDFLLQQLEISSSSNDTSAIVHLLLAMGNTGSTRVVATLLSYLECESSNVQQAAIVALVKFTCLREVLDAVQTVLASDPDEEIISVITKTLIKGQLYAEGMEIEQQVDVSHPVFSTLATAAINTNDTDLINQVAIYIRKVGGEQATGLLDQLHNRLRRGTDWDAYNSDYDCVASQSSRASDVIAYPKHQAYIYGKTLGNSNVNLKVGGGVFVGMSNDCNNMKGFARACARAKFFDETRDLAEIEFRVIKTGATISGRAYIQFGGNTLLNYQNSVDAIYCFSYERTLYQNRQRLFKFTYSIFIYVGTVDASISMYLTLNADFEARLCASLDANELLSGTTAIIPSVSLTVDGSASFTFIVSLHRYQ